jgi:hypothetical protein
MTPELRNKMRQQYWLAEMNRRQQIRQLREWIAELQEQRLDIRLYSPPPFGWLEKANHAVMDRIQKKFIRKIWLRMRRKKEDR